MKIDNQIPTYNENIISYNQTEHDNAHPFFNKLIWLTTDETAFFLRKSAHAIRQLVYKGKIQARKFNGRLYFKKSELYELIDMSFY